MEPALLLGRAILVGFTPYGRATVAVLNINEPEAVATRAALIEAGLFPADLSIDQFSCS
jgi:hypothetical protein